VGAHQCGSSYGGAASLNVQMTFDIRNIDMVDLGCGFLGGRSGSPLLRKTCDRLCSYKAFLLCEFDSVLLVWRALRSIFHKHHNGKERLDLS